VNKRILNVLKKMEEMDKTITFDDSDIPTAIENFHPGEEIKTWQIPRSTGEFLNFLVYLLKPKRILELCTSIGYSTIWIAEAANTYGGNVKTLEIFKPKIAIAKKNFKKSGLNNITLIECDAVEYTKKYKYKIDLLFLDAAKEEYITYYHNLLPNFKSGSVIIADNACSHRENIQDYINYLQRDKRVKNYFLNIDNGLLMTCFL